VKAGAAALHVHPRGADGIETLEAGACAAAVTAIRERCPGIPVGLSTGAWMAPEPGARERLLESWTILPDFVSVNFSEKGTAEICATLIRRGVGIEAGLWSVDDVRVLIDSGLAPWCLRVLIETQPPDRAEAVAAAAAMDADLDEAQVWLPRLHHGDGLATWSVLDAALARGHDIRVGLEDTLQLPDGSRARDNAALVAEAVRMVRRHGHRPAAGTGMPV